MHRNVFAAAAVAVMAGTVFSASTDYCFPSANPPGAKKPADVKQLVSLIWDDNGYSGEVGTPYEHRELKTGENVIPYAETNWVGGKGPIWDGKGGIASQNSLGVTYPNSLGINEGGLGMSWAVKTLGGKLGTNGHMTFNMIGGLFVPAFGTKWYDRESEYGSYDNGKTKDDDGNEVDFRAPANNGREFLIVNGSSPTGTNVEQISYMVQGVKKMLGKGHEMGNHTIDHIETNAPYPKSVFDKFGYGEGFDDGTSGQDALGRPFDEAEEFGTSGAALTMGWKGYAGKALSQKAWAGVITAGEEPVTKYAGKSPKGAFRAPRLEVNSNLFFALAEKGYTYDCGLEEGYEENVDGTNFLWPYTTDNGSVNVWTQKANGENIYIDSMPSGLWQYPVNVMIVPENLRGEVWENYNKMATACGDSYIESKDDFSKHGKITGFDFNMFILYGMTGPNVRATLNNSLKLRMDGNKAPMHVGCHTDYFTPMYDYATLSSSFNKTRYGLVITEGWNTWKDRKLAFEGFVDDAVKAGALFRSGKEVIDSVKAWQKGEVFGTENTYTNMTWKLVDESGTTNGASTVVGDFNNNKISVPNDNADATYYTYEGAGKFAGLTHIALEYRTNTALALQLWVDGDKPWEVLLNNLNYDAKSGKIPLSAFHYNEFDKGTATSIDVSKITGIAIRALSDSSGVDAEFTAKNFKLYGAKVTTPISGIVSGQSSYIKLNGINANTLNLNVSTAGVYNIDVFTANGRIVRSLNGQNLTAGANSVSMNALPAGVYMMKISTKNKSQVLKAIVM